VNKGEAKYVDFGYNNYSIIEVPYTHYSFNEQIGYWWFLNRQKFDLVHFTNFNHPIMYRGKFVVTIHDLTLMFFPGRVRRFWLGSAFVQWAYRLTMKSAVANSTKVLAITEFTKKDVMKYLGAKDEKVEVIYEASDEKIQLSTDQNFIKKVKEKFGLSKPFYFFLSNLRIHKNVERMVKAFEIIKDQGLDMQLLIVGKPDPRYPEALLSIENSKYKKDIIRPGFVPDDEVAVFYTEAIAFVYPTLYEGFGLPGLEAMSCGLPVIASEASCLPEVLGEGVLYFDPYDPNEIAGAMRKIYEDKELRQKLIIAGHKQYQKYSWEKMGKEIVEMYGRILQ
jgi:glycosyltransferase involved in cell wall biosynthesis